MIALLSLVIGAVTAFVIARMAWNGKGTRPL